MDVDVVSDALADEQPDHIRRERERTVLRKRAMQGDNERMCSYIRYETTMIAGTVSPSGA